MAVCRLTPQIRHWIPTHEATLLWQWACQGGEIPVNVMVRLSAPMVDQNAPLPQALADIGVKRSTVHTEEPPEGAFACIAPSQGGECRDCRACWSRNLDTVSYHKY